MQKTILILAAAAMVSSPAAAREARADGVTILPVAYEALRDGRPADAVAQLTASDAVSERDPSRLINLGTAYARLGRTSDAAAMYRAAVDSPIRYDLELADGRYMDSRWAARLALAGLTQKGRVTIALAAGR
jgi:Tfp pilus assembly protein PilF